MATLADMETHSAPAGRPSPSEAAAALAEASSARKAIVTVPGPRWTILALVVGTGLLPLINMLPTLPGIAAAVAWCVGLGVVLRAHVTRTGIVYRAPRHWRWLMAGYGVAAVVLFVGGKLLDDAAGLWWIWLVVSPLVMLLMVALLGHTERLVRKDSA